MAVVPNAWGAVEGMYVAFLNDGKSAGTFGEHYVASGAGGGDLCRDTA